MKHRISRKAGGRYKKALERHLFGTQGLARKVRHIDPNTLTVEQQKAALEPASRVSPCRKQRVPICLSVPRRDNDLTKALGARWSKSAERWFVWSDTENLEPFVRWARKD
jgi:hypothetical protein